MTNNFESELEIAEYMEQIYAHSNFPRWEEFKKNPDKWRKNEEDIFTSLANMESFFKKRISRAVYMWRGKFRCKSLEELQRITRDEGYKGSDLEYQPIVELRDGTSNLHDSKVEVKIGVYSKIEFRLMGGVVTND